MLADVSQPRTASDDEYPAIPSPSVQLTGRALGIDIGGTGIKAAVVDLGTGRLVTDRVRQATPHPATPDAVEDVVAAVVRQLEATGELTAEMPGGAGFPSVIRWGRALTATNLDPGWVNAPVQQMLEQRLGRPMVVINDSDAAGVAEVAHGAGEGHRGVVLMLDLGTGIGSTLFVDGRLVPNLQLGHLELHGHDAESRVSRPARHRRKLSWERWGREFNELLAQYEDDLWPDLIIIGGGMVKKFAKFEKLLTTSAPLVAAAMGNLAGIVGAARVAGGPASESGA